MKNFIVLLIAILLISTIVNSKKTSNKKS